MWELVQITAQYSNAVLVAVLPHLSDFAHKLDLPVSTPINSAQVQEFKCDPRAGQTGGAVVLTNGFRFTFLDGHVCVYRSPRSYYSLQDPAMVPRFYGTVKLNQDEALQAARSAIKKLGYQNAVFNADSLPLITPPEKTEANYIPRYLFRWLDPNWPSPKDAGSIVPVVLEVEVNASNGAVEMWITTSREARQSFPKVDVVAPLLHPSSAKPKLTGGQPTLPVSDAYAGAFLNAILPELSGFISIAGLNIPTPVTTNQVVTTNYACRMLEGKPMAQLYLTNGDRFNYQQGHFDAFYAHDAMDKFPETGRTEDFLGHINLTTDEAIALCVDVIKKLGYPDKLPKPIVSYAPKRGALECTRYTYYWKHPDQDLPFASIELDMETKTIKSIFLRDAAFQKLPDTDKKTK